MELQPLPDMLSSCTVTFCSLASWQKLTAINKQFFQLNENHAVCNFFNFIFPGAHYWTIGQRTHLSGLDKAYFVSSFDITSKTVYVVRYFNKYCPSYQS